MSEAVCSLPAVGLIAVHSSSTALGSLYPLSSSPTSHNPQHQSSPYQETQTFSIFVVQIYKHKYSLQNAPTETVFTVSKQTNVQVVVVVSEYD